MLRIRCPFCGTRDETEFRYGGPAQIDRPPESATDVQWTRYLYWVEPTAGPCRERWCHAHGCNRWFVVTRSPHSHDILATEEMPRLRELLDG